jgi:hypothetical protein
VAIRRNNLKLVNFHSPKQVDNQEVSASGLFIEEIQQIKDKSYKNVDEAIGSLVNVVCTKLRISSPLVKEALSDCISDDPKVRDVVKRELDIK